MHTTLPAARTPPARLREARRRLLDTGDVGDALVPPTLARSWLRSRDHGLAPVGRFVGAPHASGAQLSRALGQQREFVAHARPVMEFVFDQTRDTDSMVVLADADGMLLHALGDAVFVDRAQRVALRPGANWHEQWRGTNAIGTAIAEGAPVVVHGGEHYLERNAFLTCTAAPIADPAGRLLGVLDISGDHRGYHRHTLALVRSAARIIEHRLFATRHDGGLRLRLHAQVEGLGTVTEGLLAVSDDGRVVGANGVARAMLSLDTAVPDGWSIDRLLPVDAATLAAWARTPGAPPRCLRRDDGSALWLQVEGGRPAVAAAVPPRTAPPPAPAADDALATLDTGDAAMAAAIARARRVVDKPIALLLHGESGVGKELFARALHDSGARRAAPFVAVNCAALPETLIEAELFGYRAGAFTGANRDGAPGRIREAHGGTLFLDEIGDMPLALQARLLRVLQQREVVPLGGGKPQAVDFRLVCATHRDLRAAIAAGAFREDLYYRLNGLTLQLPPLRRREDQPALVARMLGELAPQREVTLSAELALAFARHRWPGNLRQLHNALATACALLDDDESEIGWQHLADDLVEDLRERRDPRDTAAAEDAVDLRAQSERTVRAVLADCAGNRSEAARRLGISRNTLYRKMRELRLN